MTTEKQEIMRKSIYLKTLPEKVLLYADEGVVLLPGGQISLIFATRKEKNFIESVIATDRLIGVTQALTVKEETIFFSTGCLGRVISFSEIENGYFVVIQGICRFDLDILLTKTKIMKAVPVNYARYKQDLLKRLQDKFIDRERLITVLKKYLNVHEITADWQEITETPNDKLVTALAMSGPFSPLEKQALLESVSLPEQCCIITTLMEMALMERTQTYQ